MLGGGMRQAGVFAAAGIVGLNSMIDRMEEDHENARKLAFGLSEFSQIIIDPESIKTNIVRFDLKEMDSDDFASRLRKNGVLYSGHSADTDVVVAAAQAYVNALNRLIVSIEKSSSIHPQDDVFLKSNL